MRTVCAAACVVLLMACSPCDAATRIAVIGSQTAGVEKLVPLVELRLGQKKEITLFCTELGFKAIDPKEGHKKDADILIQGEAFNEHAVRHGNLISVKARIEVKAVDQSSGKIVAIDRQTTVAVDLTEQIAAKNALQEAGAALAERLLPKIVTPAKGK